jgi:hypothetical protein
VVMNSEDSPSRGLGGDSREGGTVRHTRRGVVIFDMLTRALLVIMWVCIVALALAACDSGDSSHTSVVVCVPCTLPPGHCMHDHGWDEWWATLTEEEQSEWSEEHWNDCTPEELVRPTRVWYAPHEEGVE